jgi:hypothetical protein
MAKAGRVLAALRRDGWIGTRRGAATRADAERESLAAIAFALEGDPRDYDREADTMTLDVSVAPAA